MKKTLCVFWSDFLRPAWHLFGVSMIYRKFILKIVFFLTRNRAADPAVFSSLHLKSSPMLDQSTISRTVQISTFAWTLLTRISKFSSWLTRKSTLLQLNNRLPTLPIIRQLRPAHQHQSKRWTCLTIIIIVLLLCGNQIEQLFSKYIWKNLLKNL